MKIRKILVVSALLLSGYFGAAQVVEVTVQAEDEPGDALSRFVGGFARIVQDGKSFYIDTTGQYAFDKIYDGEGFGKAWAVEQFREETESDPDGIPRTVFAVYRGRDNKWGVLAPDGSWLLHPRYNYTDEIFRKYGILPENTGNTGKAGSPDLEVFEDHTGLDGTRFMVMSEGKWGVYDLEKKEMTVPAIYEKMDYCWGCGLKSDYVYASMDDRWGVVSFENKVLVPFLYEHEHWGMRSDDWVQAFKRDGVPVLIYIPDAREFAGGELMEGGFVKTLAGGKRGLSDSRGNDLLPPVYDDIRTAHDIYSQDRCPFFLLKQGDYYGIADIHGKVVQEPRYEDIRFYRDYLIFRMDGKYGIMDIEGSDVLLPGYDDIYPFEISRADGTRSYLFRTEDAGMYGFYNPENDVVVQPAFHKVEGAYSGYIGGTGVELPGLVQVEYDGKTGLLDPEGEQVMPLQYQSWDHYDSQYPQLVVVERNGNRGLFDIVLKKEVIPAAYGDVRKQERKDLVVVSTEAYGQGNKGLFTVEGKQLLPVAYTKLEPVGDLGISVSRKVYGKNGAEITVSGLFGFDGREILPVEYEGISTLSNEVWLLEQPGKNQLFLPRKEKRVPLKYPVVWKTGSPEVLLVSEDSLSGNLYRTSENRILPREYSAYYYSRKPDTANTLPVIRDFNDGLARIDITTGNRHKYGFINTMGEAVVPLEYELASDRVKHGMILLGKQDDSGTGNIKYGYADRTGKLVVPLEYDYTAQGDPVYRTENHLLLLKREPGGMQRLFMGMAGHQGKVLVEPQFSKVLPFKNGKGFLLKKGGNRYIDKNYYGNRTPPVKFGVADPGGNTVIPTVLDDIAFDGLLYHFDITVDLSFPVLGKEGEEWKYYTGTGESLKWLGKTLQEFIR
ncbi:WG repeat-containing protein [Sinomicrobium soli]|uniref:WG repeat-containing protein n=1 Tax=Sinomicrobium sp. N-1-3-6 TaxID=2219864 RepID=UPI001374C3F8|nr:WG repeat-containing protein [Sinomicrobium sp. N-1-3-6]